MDDIQVALTTTKHVVVLQNASEVLLNSTRDADIPVCVANTALGMYGPSSDVEEFELRGAQICVKMAKITQIISDKKTVFIGEDPSDLETALVDYTEQGNSVCANDFFKRWDETHSLLFEFSVFDLMGVSRFSVKGIWAEGCWQRKLTITSNETLHIVQS